MPPDKSWRVALKPVVFLTCLLPLSLLVWSALTGGLSANPIDDITDTTGRWTLRFLLITLSVRPFRQITGWSHLMRFRRTVGLFAFFYASLHFMTYIWLDQFFDFTSILKDIPQRPFITAGFVGFLSLIPLALTSTKKWIVRLGGKYWQLLHRLIYLSAAAGVCHYLWMVKADTLRPLTYGIILSILLGFRIFMSLRLRSSV